MLINFSSLLEKYKIKPKGILHIGASHGEEFSEYMKNGIEEQIWVEAIPKYYEICKQNISSNPKAKAFNICASDKNGEEVNFKITGINEGQSSSFLDMGTHLSIHPQVLVTEEIKMRTTTIDRLMFNLDSSLYPPQYDFLNMDIQGAEIFALRGMPRMLEFVNYIYAEVNEVEVYKGNMILKDFDAYLLERGFERVELKWGVEGHWGDAFYIRSKESAKAIEEPQDYTVEINDDKFILDKKVFELLLNVSKERDYYKDMCFKLKQKTEDKN